MNDRLRQRLKYFPLRRLFPNMVTISGLCCGLMAVRFSMLERWETAVAFLLAAAILDGMDGRLARLLKSTSTFGAQLDSLVDFVCFGVTPGLIIFLWKMHEVKAYGWACVLLFAICCALRLARFNTALIEGENKPWQKAFFTGVPAPAGGMLAMLPVALSFRVESSAFDNPAFTIAYMALIALLMVSRLPTLSLKGIRIRHDYVLPVMLLFGFLVVSFINEPWITFAICMLIYLLHIPASMILYRRMERANQA